MNYLLEALHVLQNKMGSLADTVLIMTAGEDYNEIKDDIPFDSIGLGYVAMNALPEIFSLSTCFVSPSINDAGPMMVNQSLSCGTPVVGFEMGAVLQVVKDKETGVCVKSKDTEALANGILQILQMDKNEYAVMSQRCREVAIQTSSFEAQASFISSIYEKYRNQ